MQKNRLIGGLMGLILVVQSSAVHAWHAGGHMLVARAAVSTLPEEVPAFFREAGPVLAHLSVDPDAFKHRKTPQLTDREEPDHYIDFELLQGEILPDKRHAYLELCQKLAIKPAKVGYLPYALAEHTQKLTLAFAEYRRFPEHPAIQMKVQVYAGLLAHYAADLSMPLHTTIHFNGRADPVTGQSPRTGIHARIDALIEQLQFPVEELAQGIAPVVMEELFAGIVTEIQRSHRFVDATYDLEPFLPGKDATPKDIDPKVRAFARERARHAVQVLTNLYLTAWRDSAQVELPDWLVQARQQDR